jgi:hypothetical protein
MLQEIDLDAEHDSAKNWCTRAEELLDASDRANEEARRWDEIALLSDDSSRVVYAQGNAKWSREMGFTYLKSFDRFWQEAKRADVLGRD